MLKASQAVRFSHRESAGDFSAVIARSNKVRVIVCKDGIQWIIQKRAGLRRGQPRWDSVSYCLTRKALIRLCRASEGGSDPDFLRELEMLPEFFRRGV